MKGAKSRNTRNTESLCGICHSHIPAGKEYKHGCKVLCENCCINMRTPRVRKTHWQYLGSIKAEYLIPGKNTK